MSRPADAQVAYQEVAYQGGAYRQAAHPDETYPDGADAHGPGPDVAFPPHAYRAVAVPGPARRRRRSRLPVVASLAALTVAGWVLLTRPDGHDAARLDGAPPPVAVLAGRDPAPAPRRDPAPRPDIAWMLDPVPALGAGAGAFGDAEPPAPVFLAAAPSPAVREIARTLAPAQPEPVRIAEAAPTPATLVPLPVARPPALRRPVFAPAQRMAAGLLPGPLPRTRDVFRAAMAPEPSFLERLFGAAPAVAPRQALAYADPDGLPQPRPRTRISPAPEVSREASPAAGTAVYDITARAVTLPSGEVLEAHSGLGEAMDDPRYVHLRMRGATPPGTYDLTERERPFHGVRAIRLNPVGGSGAVHGRDGLLAHTYMLRQPGASNGCVAFRSYDRFLQAFLRGEVRRLVVVAGGRGDFFGGRRFGSSDRPGG